MHQGPQPGVKTDWHHCLRTSNIPNYWGKPHSPQISDSVMIFITLSRYVVKIFHRQHAIAYPQTHGAYPYLPPSIGSMPLPAPKHMEHALAFPKTQSYNMWRSRGFDLHHNVSNVVVKTSSVGHELYMNSTS